MPLSDPKPVIELIDTHIHLFPLSELSSLAWCKPGNPLASQHSISQYRSAVAPETTEDTRFVNRGFVFLETDRWSGLEPTEWEDALKEVDWLTRIATGRPRDGEGHEANDKDLVLGVVPWAPLPAGEEKVREYVARVIERAGSSEGKVVGFRYLVQDKPRGTMLGEGFIEGLKYLGRSGYSFDLGVDFRQGGAWQLEEAVEMVGRAHQGVREEDRAVFVINHMCKPNMRVPYKSDEKVDGMEGSFETWKRYIDELAKFENTYMKISGGFSEIEPLASWEEQSEEDPVYRLVRFKELIPHISRYIDVVWDAFGAERCIWGSDWPVCNIGGGGNRLAWRDWLWIVSSWAEKRNLSEDETKALLGGTAAKVYKIPEYGDGKGKELWAEDFERLKPVPFLRKN